MEKKNCFYGIEPYMMIWHGEWADPEVTDGDKYVDYYDLETPLYEHWKAEVEGQTFEEWMKTDEAAEMTKEFFENAQSSRIKQQER